MSIAFRFTGILILGIAAIVAAFAIGGAKAHAAGGATFDCWVPAEVECDIAHPDGIANVTVSVDYGIFGTVNVVDQDFACQENVQVSFPAGVPNYEIEVTPCSPLGLKSGGGSVSPIIAGLIILAHSDGARVIPTLSDDGYGGPDTLTRR